MLGETAEVGSGANSSKGNIKTATLDEFGTNLTKLASESKLDPVVGRYEEIDRVVQILGRRTKNNPVLIGEPGVVNSTRRFSPKNTVKDILHT